MPSLTEQQIADLYAPYFETLKTGKPMPLHDGHPIPGFYRRRAHKGGPFLPVALWPDPDTGVIVGNYDGKFLDANAVDDIWTWVCSNPVPESHYRAAEAGEPWPDADSRTPKPGSRDGKAGAGDNLPPEDEEPKTEDEALRAEIDATLKGVEDYDAIDSDEKSARAQSLRSRLLELSGEAKKKHKVEKAPWLKGGKDVDAKWFVLRDLAQGGADKIRASMGGWENAKLTREREAERQRAEEERKAAQQAADDEAARKKAEAAGKPAPAPKPAPPPPPPPPAPPPTTKIKGGYGRAANVGTVNVVTVIDQDAVYGFLRDHPELVRHIAELAKRAVDAGHTVPGTEVKQERTVK